MRARAGWLAVLLGLTACAFGEGQPFGRLSATVQARYHELSDRDAGEGYQKLSSDYQIRLSSLRLEVDAVELRDTGASGLSTFDPANPPPGYSLCHNGHCHRDDGALVDYAEIEAELVGSDVTATVVAVLSGGPVELLDGEALALACAEACTLGRSHLGFTRLTASRLSFTGEVRDGRAEPRIDGVREVRAQALSLLGEDAAGRFDQALDVPVNEDEPIDIALAYRLATDARLFDGVDFGELAAAKGEPIDLADAGAEEARATLLANLREATLNVDVTREDR